MAGYRAHGTASRPSSPPNCRQNSVPTAHRRSTWLRPRSLRSWSQLPSTSERNLNMEQPPAALIRHRNAGRRESEPVYWDIDDVQFHCRIGRSTAWRLVREEGFPAPIVLGRRTLVWPRVEVITFVEDRRDPSHYSADSSDSQPIGFTIRANRRRAG